MYRKNLQKTVLQFNPIFYYRCVSIPFIGKLTKTPIIFYKDFQTVLITTLLKNQYFRKTIAQFTYIHTHIHNWPSQPFNLDY